MTELNPAIIRVNRQKALQPPLMRPSGRPVSGASREFKSLCPSSARQHVDFDAQARRDELKLHGDRAPLAGHGGDRKSEDVTNQDDNVILKEQGNSAAYLAARLKRDHPEIA